MAAGVDWPRTPVDRLQDFRPSICPRRDCPHHTRSADFRYRKHTPYRTTRGSVVQRFRCRQCGRTFSRRSFSLAYYRKRPELLRPVAAGLQAGSGQGRRLHIVNDGHPAYEQAVRQHPRTAEIQMESHPNPKRGPKGSPRSEAVSGTQETSWDLARTLPPRLDDARAAFQPQTPTGVYLLTAQ